MGTITALTTQQRNPNRVNVHLDGAFAFGLAAVTAVSLRIGQTLTTAEIEKLQQADELENAKQSAIRYIEYRPRSMAEVRTHLRQKGFVDTAVDQACERLQEVGLLDDAAFARYWVEQRETFKPRSRMALRQELQQKGVSRDVMESVITEVDETEAARQAAQKQVARWQRLPGAGQLPEAEFKQKLSSYLQRRGFSYDLIKQIVNECWNERNHE
ncbi:MAG: RecX family transcriptional regulator [Anaerolineae bacterium]|nr:RecX family transcriptional regulator [Anaerolineae bacterium]